MNKKVVILGGGHGQAAICRALRQFEDVQMSAIVTVADDGGSTGRLRRQFHIPAMGDIRNVMLAMSESESLMRNLMDYRFDDPQQKEQDIAGHNLGNLILTALTQQTGSFMEAIEKISNILNVHGTIIPSSLQVISLFAKMEDGVIVKGEANIPDRNHHIERVFYQDDVKATPSALEAIEQADLIIYGIGSLYTSILPNIIVPEIQQAIVKAKAKKIYVCNAMSQPGETDGYSVEDHVQALLDHGAVVDEVIVADDVIPQYCLHEYALQGSTYVHLTKEEHPYDVCKASLLRFDGHLIRHDTQKIAKILKQKLEEICPLP